MDYPPDSGLFRGSLPYWFAAGRLLVSRTLTGNKWFKVFADLIVLPLRRDGPGFSRALRMVGIPQLSMQQTSRRTLCCQSYTRQVCHSMAWDRDHVRFTLAIALGIPERLCVILESITSRVAQNLRALL